MEKDDQGFDALPAAGLLRFEDSMQVVSGDAADFVVIDAGVYAFADHELQNFVDGAVCGRYAICGQSRNSVCYKIAVQGLSNADSVLKQAVISNHRTNPDSTFSREAEVLKKLARLEIPNCPELLAHFRYRGRYYLLLTFVPGAHPDPQHVPLRKSVLQQLFDAFFLMDQAGFIHYDLQAHNIVVSRRRIGFIDFEFAGLANPFSVKDERYVCDYNISSNPHVPLRSCVCNFEFRTVYPYLSLLRLSSPGRDILAFARTYLDCKAAYHARMAEYFSSVAAGCAEGAVDLFQDGLSIQALQRGARHESIFAGLYRNPSPEILATEYLILKLRFHLFERDFNGCCCDLKTEFCYARSKVLRFADKAKHTPEAGYFNACIELLGKLERKAGVAEASKGQC